MPGIWPPPNRIRFRRVSVSVTASIKRRSCVELTLTSAQSNGAVFSLCISVGHSRVRICSLLLAFGLAFVLLSAIPEENLLLRPVAAARAKPKKSRFGNCHPGAPLSVLIVRLNALFLGAKSIICSACSRKLTQVGHPPLWMPAGNLLLSTAYCMHRASKAQYLVVEGAKNTVFARNLGRKKATRKSRCQTHTNSRLQFGLNRRTVMRLPRLLPGGMTRSRWNEYNRK